jgi:hypothetical protein
MRLGQQDGHQDQRKQEQKQHMALVFIQGAVHLLPQRVARRPQQVNADR